MSNETIRAEFLANVADYIIIDDGAFRYIMDRDDLTGSSAGELSAMTGDEYSEWCQDNPCNDRYAIVGDGRLTDLCNDMIEAGAEVWHIA